MNNRCMRKWPTPLIVKEMQTAATIRYHLIPVSIVLSKRKVITMVGEGVEKKDTFYSVAGNVNQCSSFGKQFGCSSKSIKLNQPHDSTIPRLSIHPKEKKSVSEKDMCTLTFLVSFFTIAYYVNSLHIHPQIRG